MDARRARLVASPPSRPHSSPDVPYHSHLRFLNDDASSVGQQSEDRRKAVRSHVMYEIHRRSRQAAVQRLRGGDHRSHEVASKLRDSSGTLQRRRPRAQKETTVRPSKIKFDSDSRIHTEKALQSPSHIEPSPDFDTVMPNTILPSPASLLSQDISDPFDAFSMPIGQAEVRNVHHFFHNILPRRKNFQTAIWAAYNILLQDPAVLVFVLSKAILHLAMVSGRRLDQPDLSSETEFLRYKLKGTKLIGEKLTNNNAISDANFLAIVDLITCFTSRGEADEALTHLRGLRQMLKLRGGMQQLSPFLAYRVILADTTVASMMGSSPLIEVPSGMESVRDRKVVASISTFASVNIVTSFSMLRYAFALEDFTERVSANLLFLERDLLVESRLYDESLYSTEVGSPKHKEEAMRLAIIIYIEFNLVISWRRSHIIRNLVQRLKKTLERTPLDLMWLPFSTALLLVLLIGGVGAEGWPERSWFVSQLRGLAGAVGLQAFEAVRASTGVTSFLEGDTEEAMKRVWKEVENAKLVEIQ